ncbi:MAG TPA: alpha-L-fucosidase [Fimbriimonadaceae bacterium]|nr:alpha-L-fucosidase [Fimbriimonadaceae bacterium]
MKYDIPQPVRTDGDTSWFTEARFGMFIHWGLYALAARHEWVKSIERISDADYQKYFERFDPDLFDPDAWAQAAADAGMKYFVITTKHHEGFCLWDSKLTDYKATNTPAGRDLLRPMVEAFRKRGMRVGFYHSLLDWHHDHYTIDQHHPARDGDVAAFDKGRDLSKYTDFLHAQTRELLTEFGRVDILWYDFSPAASDRFPGKGKNEWRSDELIKLVRSLQPKIILDDRLEIDQDLKTPEQFQPAGWVQVNGKPVVWEACQTFSGSWGYHRDEASWKSVDLLIRMLVDTVSKGGNLLLNVGPTGRGEFDHRALERLAGIGRWMRRHGRSIYGCTQAPSDMHAPSDVRYTFNPATERLYAHLFAYPFRHLFLPGLKGKVKYAQLLNDASEVKILASVPEHGYGAGVEGQSKRDAITLELPIPGPNEPVPVVELFLK